MTVAVSVLAGVLGGILYERLQPVPLRIEVLDMRRVVEAVARDASLDEAQRQGRTKDLGEMVSRYVNEQASNGVIVLDGTAVLRAPASVYVEPY